MSRAWCAGVHTINVVRDRPDMQALIEDLSRLGATVVTTEQDVKQATKVAGLEQPVLGLNCVGGSSATALAKTLACVLRLLAQLCALLTVEAQPVWLWTSTRAFRRVIMSSSALGGHALRDQWSRCHHAA